MIKHEQNAAEERRLSALQRYAILDTPVEEAFDELARLASRICNASISTISFIDQTRQWIKSIVGCGGVREIGREDSLCAQTLGAEEILLIEDTLLDPRSKEKTIVRAEPGIRFYAGVPIKAPSGIEAPFDNGQIAIGVFAVMDTNPRKLRPEEAEALKTLARQVVTQLELRRSIAELSEKHTQTESALRHSETFYHSLVETLPQNIFRKDLEGRFTFANSRFAAALKRPVNEILGKTDADFFSAELAAKYHQDDLYVIRSKETLNTIEQHPATDGSILYVRVLKTPLYDPRGAVIGIQGIFWDETERYKAKEALLYERALFRAMLDHIPDSIYFKDRESRFLAVSQSLAVRLGLSSPEEAVGKTDLDFFAQEHAQEALQDELLILRSGQAIVAKAEREISRTGRESWVLTTKVPLTNSNGKVIGTFGISKDITDIKAAEAELAMARDAALESARMKSEFLANMSHEIRTPLNAVVGMTGLLLDTPLSEEQRDFTETIRNSADALLNIINDILDFSRIEAGKLAIEVIEFDLAEIVEGAAELVAEPAQTKGLELLTWVHEEVPRLLRGDPGRLRQVLTNLVGNAVKFTERGEVVVDVSKERETDSTVTLKFAVRDTGVGIPFDAQSRIFQAFTQADGSTTRRYGGTGLGLAISKQLVELMRGQMGFKSAPGQGSTFWLTIPFEKQPDQKLVPPRASTLEGLRVMVVDDNETNRQIVRHQIVSWKMRNESAQDGANALRLLRAAAEEADPYQLLILDMQMPGMDGLGLARQIKGDRYLAGTRMIMLTSVGHLPEERLWRECGISAYLIKPVKEARLFETIISVMRGVSGAGHLPRQGALNSNRDDQPGRSLRVLVAEDNVINQKVTLRQLQKLGFSADAVANGLEVLHAIERIPYDVILMDCQMPELDGYETTRRIRLEESRARLRGNIEQQYIVAMTANALTGDREECIAAGMNDYVSKPVRMDELCSALDRATRFVQSQQAEADSNSISGPVLDQAVIESLRELRTPNEPDPLSELVEIFVADTPGRIEKIESTARVKDFHELETACHALKGSASNIGAIGLANYCASLLREARDGFRDPDEKKIGERLRKQFEKTKAALLEEKAKP
jgi:two-component system sensor histidine kinase/response regulator